MPTTPYDAKGMLVSAVEDDAPVVVIEHRWLYSIQGEVPERALPRAARTRRGFARSGKDVTIAATSYMTLEALRAAELLDKVGNFRRSDRSALLDADRHRNSLRLHPPHRPPRDRGYRARRLRGRGRGHALRRRRRVRGPEIGAALGWSAARSDADDAGASGPLLSARTATSPRPRWQRWAATLFFRPSPPTRENGSMFPIPLTRDRIDDCGAAKRRRLFAALGSGASAWKVKPRDQLIGWATDQRKRDLHYIVNNAASDPVVDPL